MEREDHVRVVDESAVKRRHEFGCVSWREWHGMQVRLRWYMRVIREHPSRSGTPQRNRFDIDPCRVFVIPKDRRHPDVP